MMTLRLATPQDSAALVEIYRPYVEQTSISFETEVPSETEFRQRILRFSAMYPYLVAQEDGRILGYAYAHAFHDRAAYSWTVETSIYVAEDTRRRHVGRTLYRALLELLACQGVKNACAVITIPNDPSTAFHQAMGFETCGVMPEFGYKLGAWHSVTYLSRRLGSLDPAPAPVVPIGRLPAEQVAQILNDAIS